MIPFSKNISKAGINRRRDIHRHKEGSLTRKYIPVTCGSSTKEYRHLNLLDTILLCLPSPTRNDSHISIRGRNPKTAKKL
jgi:translation elongation factor EF-G